MITLNQRHLLLYAIAINKKYREEKAVLSYLLKGLSKKINNLLSRGIKFKNMCAEVKQKMVKNSLKVFLDLKEKGLTKEGYKLYSFDNTDEFLKWFKRFPKYIEEYDKKIKL